MPEESETPIDKEQDPGPSQAPWERTLFRMFAIVIAAGCGLYVFKSCRDLPVETAEKAVDKTMQVITNVGQAVATVAAAFHKGTVSLSLDSTGTELENTQYFQFKKVRQTEIFTHTDQAVTGFGYLPLPDVIVEARAPVEYTYYLDLSDAWRFLLEGDTVHVLTPDIHYNKPAVDVSKLEYQVRKDSFFRDSDAALEHLRKSLSSLAYLKAAENLKLVRSTGREPVAEFVQSWLLRSFADGTNYEVKVYFPGDALPEELGRTWAVEGD